MASASRPCPASRQAQHARSVPPTPPPAPLSARAGSASIYATGQILHETHDWGLVFASTSALYLMGAGVYLAWASSEEQFASE